MTESIRKQQYEFELKLRKKFMNNNGGSSQLCTKVADSWAGPPAESKRRKS